MFPEDVFYRNFLCVLYTNGMNENDDRITELEIKLSLTEDAVDQLDAVVTRQQTQIDRLELVVIALKTQIERLDSSADNNSGQGGVASLRDELPPHY